MGVLLNPAAKMRPSAEIPPGGSPGLNHSYDTAAVHATADVPMVTAGMRAGDARRQIAGRRYASATHVAVCEGDRLRGIVRIEDLLAADERTPVSEFMDADPPTVSPKTDQEVAAWQAVRKGESALPVVNGFGRFVGLIPPDRLVAVLLEEHEEDLSRFGGILKRAAAARISSEEPIERRFLHRIPWLLLGLGGALVAADVVASFESVLQQKVMLAFFIPGIVYLADAVGTQTETVIVRGLSVGVPLRRMVARELATGLAIGLVVGLATGPVLWLRWGDAVVALSVAMALFAACATATLTAMALPAIFDTLGRDPAFASGPLATVVQDLLSLFIYFAVVVRLPA
jgi:magnesium transporter